VSLVIDFLQAMFDWVLSSVGDAARDTFDLIPREYSREGL